MLAFALRALNLYLQYVRANAHVKNTQMNGLERSLCSMMFKSGKMDGRSLAFFSFVVAGISSIPAAFFVVTNPSGLIYTNHCGNYEWVPLQIFAFTFIVVNGALLYVIRRTEDALHIKQFMVYVIIGFLFFQTVGSAMEIIDNLGVAGNLHAFFEMTEYCCYILSILVCHYFNVTLPILQEMYWDHKKESRMNGKSGACKDIYQFEEQLNDPVFYQEFTKFLAKEFCTENGVFFKEMKAVCAAAFGDSATTSVKKSRVNDTRNLLFQPSSAHIGSVASEMSGESSDEKQMVVHLKEAMNQQVKTMVTKLVDTYIRVDASFELNIPDRYREAILSDHEKEVFSLNTWRPAYKEVLDMMYKNTYARYLASLAKDKK